MGDEEMRSVWLGVAEFLVGEESCDGSRCLLRGAAALVDTGSEGEGAMVEHELGEGRGSGLDAEVAEHGV